MAPVSPDVPTPPPVLGRFVRWLLLASAAAISLYVLYVVIRGAWGLWDELGAFRWEFFGLVLLLTLVNYAARIAKWVWLLSRLGVRLPLKLNVHIFAAGMAMAITPGKAGEVLKPWLIKQVSDVPMARTVPAFLSERATDALALALLAALGVGTYFAEGTWVVLVTLGSIAALVTAVMVEPLGKGILRACRPLPWSNRWLPSVEASYQAIRVVLSPVALLFTLALSLVAWGAECVGFWLVFQGLGEQANLGVATFIYAFATLFGTPAPGGLGMADAALVEGSLALVPGLAPEQALAAALIIRLATLWFGVIVGALALLGIRPALDAHRQAQEGAGG